MAKYYIRKNSLLGLDLLNLGDQSNTMVERNEELGLLTKTEILERVNEIIRSAKKIRNRIQFDLYQMDNYKVI